MKRRVFYIFLTTLCMFWFFTQSIQAAGRPDVTRHEAQFLGGALNMQIEWQSPNPVVLIKISIANIQKEIKIDAYDNKRNRDGYAGEVNFTLNIEGVPSEPFPYVLQLEDELRIKSTLTRGKVKISSSQPGVVLQPQQPSMQMQQNLPQFGVPQSGIPPYAQPGFQPGIQPGTFPGIQPDIQPYAQPGAFPGIPPGQQPYAQPGFQPGLQPGALPGIQPGLQPGALPGIPPGLQPGALPGMITGALPGVQSFSQQVGSLIVIIAPLIAAEGGAMWRAGDGPWKRSGEFIPDLPVGIHTIEFQDLSGWTKPERQKVMIEGGQTVTINGIYHNR